MKTAKHNLTQLAFAAVAQRLDLASATSPEAVFLAQHAKLLSAESLPEAVACALAQPGRDDEPLATLAWAGGLAPGEVLSIALAAAVEQSALAGRAVGFAQAPAGGSRPTLGLLAEVFGHLEPAHSSPVQFAQGRAVQSGVLALLHEEAPLPERTVAVPPALCQALAGGEGAWPGGALAADDDHELLLSESLRAACRKQAAALSEPDSPVLVIRSAHGEEAHAVATEIARALELRPFFIETASLAGLGAWMLLRRLLPVFVLDPAPGETKIVPIIPLHRGPVLALAGIEGTVEAAMHETIHWPLAVPDVRERERLWTRMIPENGAGAELARTHRQSAARIIQLGRLARHQARLENNSSPGAALVRAVSRSGAGSGLGSLAQPLPDVVSDEAIVLTTETRAELDALVARCKHRDGLVTGIGLAAGARYTPGVRALFTGPSGTGKTLAVCWLATKLGLPLFRVDLASVTSKYIGETEKNLARLLARAERTEAILLFDEADSLFGKRTDVRDSNDRFANAQTNYLLQRIEVFDGIALLTSNSRARFDTAFARRLDMVIEFPLPGPVERRALWLAHLGEGHALSIQELNSLAGQCDLAGGQIRNVVLRAAVAAREASSQSSITHKIDFAKIARALAAEYKKHGRSLPPALAGAANEANGR